jgi:small subunit ribosomal protein S2
MTRLPAAMFIVDVSKEHIAVREAKRLNIPLFAIVDTNSDPTPIDFPIPANDDASKSISLILDKVIKAIQEGLDERKMEREKEGDAKKGSTKKAKSDAKKTSARKEPQQSTSEGNVPKKDTEVKPAPSKNTNEAKETKKEETKE